MKWLRTGYSRVSLHRKQCPSAKKIDAMIDNIIKEFGDHTLTKSHSRHIPAQKCKEIGLKIEMMEDHQDLQEAILTLHHITMLTLTHTPSLKIVENQDGKASITVARLG